MPVMGATVCEIVYSVMEAIFVQHGKGASDAAFLPRPPAKMIRGAITYCCYMALWLWKAEPT